MEKEEKNITLKDGVIAIPSGYKKRLFWNIFIMWITILFLILLNGFSLYKIRKFLETNTCDYNSIINTSVNDTNKLPDKEM